VLGREAVKLWWLYEMNNTLTLLEALPKSRGHFEAFITSIPLLGLPAVRSSTLQSQTWKNSNVPQVRRPTRSL